jgi:Protein of unknown function (DUF4235)
MSRIIFIPFSIVAGFAAAFAGRKLFDAAWGIVDDEEPPEPEHRDVSWGKLLAALALQGAVFAATRGLAERAARVWFARVTGTWPGEKEPDAS